MRTTKVQRVVAPQYKDSGVTIGLDTTVSLLKDKNAHKASGLPLLVEPDIEVTGLVDLALRALESQTCHREMTSGWQLKQQIYAIVL